MPYTKNEPQNIEYSAGGGQNIEGWFRFAQPIIIKWIEYLTSKFEIHYSIFDIRFYHFKASYAY